MKKIIVTIVDGFHYRYLIDSGVMQFLNDKGLVIKFVVIDSLRKRLEEETRHFENVTIESLASVKLTTWVRLYLTLINNTNKKLTETLNVKNELAKVQSPVRHFLLKTLRSFSNTALYKIGLAQAAKVFASKYYQNMLHDFRPALVVFSTPGQKLPDLPLLYECNKANIPTVSPVYSWDNLTAKGPFIFPVDHLIVWNDIMKREAEVYHDYASHQISVTGVPVFDPYVSVLAEEPHKKEAFFQRLKLNPTRPLITVTTIPRIFFGSGHGELIVRLVDFMKQGLIPECNILVRPHPKDTTDYSVFKSHPIVTLDFYGSTPDDSLQNWIPQKDNIEYLGRTMRYSDIVINVASTITIDASCFDTPVINIAYDMKKSEDDYIGNVSRYYSYTHYNHVVRSNAAALVKNDDELIAAVNGYLNNRQLHSEERNALVKQQSGCLDGKAHIRVAEAILKQIPDANRH
jgi:hypothetical protein